MLWSKEARGGSIRGVKGGVKCYSKDRFIETKSNYFVVTSRLFSRRRYLFENDESLESGRVRFRACLKIYLLVLLKAAMEPMSGRV